MRFLKSTSELKKLVVRYASHDLKQNIKKPYIFYRGTNAIGADEAANSNDQPNNVSASIIQIKQGSDLHLITSGLWRVGGLVFQFDEKELDKKLCFLSPRDGFTGISGDEDEFGNYIDDNKAQQNHPPLTPKKRQEEIHNFLQKYHNTSDLTKPFYLNEALLGLAKQDYLQAKPCLNGNMVTKNNFKEFTNLVDRFNKFKGIDQSPIFVALDGNIHYVEKENSKKFCESIKQHLEKNAFLSL